MTGEKNTEINTQRAMLDFFAPLDYRLMMMYIDLMLERYSFISVNYIGESLLGKGIPMITLGEGDKQVLYVGAHMGGDWTGSIILLKFVNEYCEILKNDGRIFNYSVKYLFGTRKICIVPMLNPDGVDININGVTEDNILKDRLLSMNNGDGDFSSWQANARGVTLSGNYRAVFNEYRRRAAEEGITSGCAKGFSGERPESEPETGALCAYFRFNDRLSAALSLNGRGERVFYKYGDVSVPRAKSIGKAVSRRSGYRLQEVGEQFGDCGFVGFCNSELKIPALNLMYSGKNVGKVGDVCFDTYARLRETLFTFPALV